MGLNVGEPGFIGAHITTMYLVWRDSARYCCTGPCTPPLLLISVHLRRSGAMWFPRPVELYSRVLEYCEHA